MSLKELEEHAVDCKRKVFTLEQRHQDRVSTLDKYHQSLERMLSSPNFDKFNNEKRQEIESNFHRTLRETEREKRGMMEVVLEQCDSEREEWLQEKVAAAIARAKTLITHDLVQFKEILNGVNLYQSKLSAHMVICRTGKGLSSSVNCAIDNLEVLMNFTRAVIIAMKQIELRYNDDKMVGRYGSHWKFGTDEEESVDAYPHR